MSQIIIGYHCIVHSCKNVWTFFLSDTPSVFKLPYLIDKNKFFLLFFFNMNSECQQPVF